MSNFHAKRGAQLRRTTLAAALAVGLGLTGGAHAQSTTGSLNGQAPAAADETVMIVGDTGFTREVPVDASGRFRISNLPVGLYQVSLKQGGNVVDTRKDVSLTVGAGTTVNFAGAASSSNATALSAITVSANSLPAIDTSSVDSRTVITARELKTLPLARNAEAIALLAPGTVQGSGYFGNVISFGGAGATENAYYINGYNTSDPLANLGGVGLPYGSIDQQETYTGGYSAKYGRSDGGVLSQVGKRGTNEWHFGAQVLWEPRFADESPKNVYYSRGKILPPALGGAYTYQDPDLPGTIYRRREDNTGWTTTYAAYVGGPLIADKLFFFVAAEQEKNKRKSTSSIEAAQSSNTFLDEKQPKVYAKVDWNINDSNILEATYIHSTDSTNGDLYAYDYDTREDGNFISKFQATKNSQQFYIAKYTSYITDDLTFSATYGKSTVSTYTASLNPSTAPFLSGTARQNPAYTGGNRITNDQTETGFFPPDAGSRTHGVRADIDYRLGDHDLSVGIDNMNYGASNVGQGTSGPGYLWIYSNTSNPNLPLVPGLGVGAPGGDGYFVQQYILNTVTNASVSQQAYYLQDRWQISDRLLASIGVRNDKFTNNNALGQAYVNQDNQWAPRLGLSWDVFGDSSLKVYGNVGRYYLALPNSVAIRGASPSTFTREYFDYTGIRPDGTPILGQALGPGPVSTNDEYGQAPDPKTVTALNLKSQYQDEYILGFDKTLGSSWVAGAKATYRDLKVAIDDVCDPDRVATKLAADGGNPDDYLFRGCYIFNPGETNDIRVNRLDGTGNTTVRMTTEDWGFTKGAKRKYYALDLYLEHPYDGKWQARVDYTFSKSYGNTEGQVKSDIGQDDISKTQDWDAAALMVGSNGLLANNRKHQFKARGAYSITQEWLVSGTLRIQSGSPKSCLGFFGPYAGDPISYGNSYHFCGGQISPPGASGNNPWTRALDLAVAYRPNFADQKLAIGLDVFNVLNGRKAVQSYPRYEAEKFTVDNRYDQGLYFQTPRYARLSVSYDF